MSNYAISEAENRLTNGLGWEALNAAFNEVCDPNDWRAPINAVVSIDKLDFTLEAIRFFTATEPTFWACELGDLFVRVKSEGYRAGPAGP